MLEPVFRCELTAQDKIAEARFFLSKMNEADYRSEEKLHYLSAFLASARGILEDTILYDYASKYGLAVTLNDWLSISRFRTLASGAPGYILDRHRRREEDLGAL